MQVINSKQLPDFYFLFEKFIRDCKNGKRLQPNGKRISPGTLKNYQQTLSLLRRFCREKNTELRLMAVRRLNTREMNGEKNYWKKFYKAFTDYLYDDYACFDNYVGSVIKNIKAFFNYLNKELVIGVGDFHQHFYVPREEISIFPLLPEELNYLIYDKNFEQSLTARMREVKDFFVFGCTVALRFSDLVALKKENVRVVNGHYYLVVRSIKTNKDTLIKLPPYAISIINRHTKIKKRLLPKFNLSNMNEYVKQLLREAGFVSPIYVTRSRRGIPVVLKNKTSKTALCFCDVATTHTMRRTAITTMLSLGVREQLVRKISGHSSHGKEFYRYVLWAQTYQDQETAKMFEKLSEKKMEVVRG